MDLVLRAVRECWGVGDRAFWFRASGVTDPPAVGARPTRPGLAGRAGRCAALGLATAESIEHETRFAPNEELAQIGTEPMEPPQGSGHTTGHHWVCQPFRQRQRHRPARSHAVSTAHEVAEGS